MKLVNVITSILSQDKSVSQEQISKVLDILEGKSSEAKKEYYSQKELCSLLGVSRVTLWKWKKAGKIKPKNINGIERYKLSDIEKLMV